MENEKEIKKLNKVIIWKFSFSAYIIRRFFFFCSEYIIWRLIRLFLCLEFKLHCFLVMLKICYYNTLMHYFLQLGFCIQRPIKYFFNLCIYFEVKMCIIFVSHLESTQDPSLSQRNRIYIGFYFLFFPI